MNQQSESPVATTTPAIGAAIEGGFFAGLIRLGLDTYGVIVSPKAAGELKGAWGKAGKDVPGARSFFDGHGNTQAMAEAGSELAQKALRLSIGGHADWYLPSRDELELIYRNLKPSEEENYRWRGDNPSSVPVGYPYDDDFPAQTSVAAFREDGDEALETEWYWSSTQYSAHGAWSQHFDDGDQNGNVKGYEARARAVRRFKLNP